VDVEPTLRAAVRLAADELAEAVLPAVLTRLRSQTDRLQTLAESIAADPQAALADPTRVEFLEEDQTLGRRIGWCLGVLAAASGTDLLLARRERDGLREMVELVVLAVPGHPPTPYLEALPRLATGVGEGWEVAFLVSFAFLQVARSLPASAPLHWERKTDAGAVLLTLKRTESDRAAETLLAKLTALVPETELVPEDELLGIRLPRAWFEG